MSSAKNWLRWLVGGLVTVAAVGYGLYWWTEYQWYASLQQTSVFVRMWSAQVGLFAVGFLTGLVLLVGNFRLSRRLDKVPAWAEPRPNEMLGGPVLWALLPFALTVVAAVFGWSWAQLWDPFRLMFSGVPTGTLDPVFGRDVSFYMTWLPFWSHAQRLLTGLLLTCWLALYFRYIELPVPGDPDSYGDFRAVSPPARAHLSAVGVALFASLASWAWLARFSLLVTRRTERLHGIGYTDWHVRLPLLWVLLAAAAVVAVVLLANVRLRSLRLIGWAVGGYAVLHIGYALIPAACQALVVAPNEIDREQPYIAACIAGTRAGLGLDRVVERGYDAGGALGGGELAAYKETLATVPLWSPAEMTEQLVGTETLRSYYNFLVADYDRYVLNGQRRQVSVVVREMQVDRLESSAQNWVNRHLVYTHGLGLVMALASTAGAAGEPVKVVRDIPPRGAAELHIAEPRVYYGEIPSDYVVTGLRQGAVTRELDYPEGDQNVFTSYQGDGGLRLGSGLRRLAWALRLRSLNLLVSDLLTPASRLHYRRALMERVQALAPFLDFDSEPYPVLADGRLVWVLDAYTVSSRYPYSWPHSLQPALALRREQPELSERARPAYVRNSVKVVMDAYHGTVKFHVFDAADPLLRSYERAYPGLFTHEPLPPAVREHVRYPVDLYALQARAYARFHMTDPRVFYNGEDLWDVAREQSTTREPQPDGSYRFEINRERVTPYYVLVRLPGEDRAVFRLILPFTPASAHEAATGRDNLVGWLAADCDPDSYGRLTAFCFPKSRLVLGPMQVEALIDQDPEISAQMSLWSEHGSRVLRGRLLVIPLGDTLLYIEPIFLTAERRGALPELKRVAVQYNGVVRMAPSLGEALELTLSTASSNAASPEALRLQRLARRGQEVWNAAEAARRKGDLKAYGEQLANLERLLQEMTGAAARP